MPVIRTEKKNNFTVIDNGFLRDKTLSLKAKGLMVTMLSLPEDWKYSVRGLAAICKESRHTIHSILLEMEERGYLLRQTTRDKSGKYTSSYVIHETTGAASQSPNTVAENTVSENTVAVFCPLLNKEQSNKEEQRTEESRTYPIHPILLAYEDEPPAAALTPVDSGESGQDGYDPMPSLNPAGDFSWEETGASPAEKENLPFDERWDDELRDDDPFACDLPSPGAEDAPDPLPFAEFGEEGEEDTGGDLPSPGAEDAPATLPFAGFGEESEEDTGGDFPSPEVEDAPAALSFAEFGEEDEEDTGCGFPSPGAEEAPATLSFAGFGEEDEPGALNQRTSPGAGRAFFSRRPPPLNDPGSFDRLHQTIAGNVERDTLAGEPGFDTAQLDELILLAAQAAASQRPTLIIGGEPIPTDLVRRRMLSLRASHMLYVMECVERCGARIHNVRSYLTAALFNAPATIDSYYNAKYRRENSFVV